MAVLFTNNAATNLAASITSGSTSLSVTGGTGSLFPNPTNGDYFLLTLIGISGIPIEIVKVTSRSTDTMTIVRGQEGTTPSAFTGGDQAQLRITAGVMNGASQAGLASGGLTENTQTISSSYTISTNRNALSVGPVSVASGQTVTVPSGSRWVIL